jgi:hypothetical protein
MSTPDTKRTPAPAPSTRTWAEVECDVGRLEPKRAETPLGVHWLGGKPYMLTSEPSRGQRMRAAGYTRRPSAKSLPSDE